MVRRTVFNSIRINTSLFSTDSGFKHCVYFFTSLHGRLFLSVRDRGERGAGKQRARRGSTYMQGREGGRVWKEARRGSIGNEEKEAGHGRRQRGEV